MRPTSLLWSVCGVYSKTVNQFQTKIYELLYPTSDQNCCCVKLGCSFLYAHIRPCAQLKSGKKIFSLNRDDLVNIQLYISVFLLVFPLPSFIP